MDKATNMNNTLKTIPKFGGKAFREWRSKVRMAISYHNKGIFDVLNGEECPQDTSNPDAIEKWNTDNWDLFSILFFATTGSAHIVVRQFEGKKQSEGLGNGVAAWEALAKKYDSFTKETRRACYEELTTNKMSQGEDPDDFFTKMEDLRERLKDMGEIVSDERFEDIILQAISNDYDYVRQTSFRVRDFGLEEIKTTMRNMYIDSLSRTSTKSIAGRGVAMQASNRDSNIKCFNCNQHGHRRSDCPEVSRPRQHQQKGPRTKHWKKPSGQPGPKWCALHKTRSHSDAECYKQQRNKANNKPTGSINYANIGSARLSPKEDSDEETCGFSFASIGTSSLAPTTKDSAKSDKKERPIIALGTAPKDMHKKQTDDSGLFAAFGETYVAEPATLVAHKSTEKTDDRSITILVDSGSSEHYLDTDLHPKLRERMRDYEVLEQPHQITTAGEHVIEGTAKGTITGTFNDQNGEKQRVSLSAITVPGLGRHLFSPVVALREGVVTIFDPTQPRLEMGDVIVPMKRLGNDTTLCSVSLELDSPPNTAMRAESADLWHRRLGHINSRSLEKLRKIDDNGVDYTGDMKACDVCAVGKSAQQAHPKQATYDVTRPFQLVSTDLMGPISPPALGGFRYVSKFVDQKSKWKEIFLIKTKSDAINTLQLFNQSLVIPTELRLERLRADKGTEYTSRQYRNYCLEIGVKLEFASTNTPQQIGANERAGRTLAAMVRCLLTDSGLPKFLWGELMLTATYLSNRVPHAALGNITPYKALYGKDANLGHLRAIGARAFVHVETPTHKLSPKAWEGRLCGYSMDSKSFRIYDPEKGKVKESRNVIFIETPCTTPNPTPSNGAADDDSGYQPDSRSEEDKFGYDTNDDLMRDVMDYTSYLDLESPTSHLSAISPSSDTNDMQQLISDIQEVTSQDLLTNNIETTSPGGPEHDDSSSEEEQPAPTPSVTGRTLRSSTRVPDRAGTRSTTEVDRPSLTNQRARDTAVRPETIRELKRLALYTNTPLADIGHREERINFLEHAFVANNTQLQSCSEGEKVKTIPNTFKEAMELPEANMWKAATDKEMKSLQDLKVYKLVPRTDVPSGHKVIGSKWVFKVKPDGTHKARVVAKGWNQVPGRDCGGTFAPVCRLQSIRMVLAIATEKDLEVIQLDVKTAFLYADIEEDVFVEMAPGYETTSEEGLQLVMKLEKSLYGLAQSPQNWWKTIDPSLVEIGFIPLKSDTCVYIYDHNNTVVILTLYVDDLLIIGDDIRVMKTIKKKLMDKFRMTDMGDVSLVLGMQVSRDREQGELTISQENYTNSILDRFGMGSCKPVSTPGFGPELSMKQPEETLLNAEERQQYQAIVGSVMYLAQITRYDIMYCASQLARAMSNPSKIHKGAAKHLLRYLSGTRDFSITYKKGGFDLTAFSDSNWGNNPDNGKSMSSYIMMMSKAPVSFKCGLQSLTAMSTMEAELVAAALAMKEVIFCTNMMKELGFGSEFRSAPLYIDNTATLNVIGNQVFSGRTKHVALRFFYIREIVKEGRISIHYIPTEDNLADIGTKHLNKQRHKYLIDKIKSFGT